MHTYKIYIEENFADAVPVLGAYLLLLKDDTPPSKDAVNEMLDIVSTGIGESMESSCIECDADMTECGVLVNLDEEFSISCSSMCIDCLEKLAEDTEVLDMEDFQKVVSQQERSKMK